VQPYSCSVFNRKNQSAAKGLGQLFFLRLPPHGKAEDELVCPVPTDKAFVSAQSATFSAHEGSKLLSTPAKDGADLYVKISYADYLREPFGEVHRKAGCGKTARPV
jgi:hypothetical protein